MFVKSWQDQLSEALNSVSAAKARALVAQLRMRMAPVAVLMLRFATTFDRLVGHVRDRTGTTGERRRD